jgi:hydroxypyruvate isomerase
MKKDYNMSCPNSLSRREVLGAAAIATVASFSNSAKTAANDDFKPAVLHGRIKQSVVQWCFQKHWEVEQTCRVTKQLGGESVELVAPSHWPTLKKHGLICAIASSHSFTQGMNSLKYREACQEKIRATIDACAEAGFPTVITFTGFDHETDAAPGATPRRIDPDEGIRNCVAGYKEIMGYAEKKGINLALEMLNSRVDENMKGHPGYQGDHIDYCLEIIRQVGSPRFGLLFDIYHVQIMDGDIIRRIHQCKDVILHVHTAGNPGRRELDDQQEINYPPIMRALLDIGYTGYVGQEFIPTGDPLDGLQSAVQLCDV